MRSHESTLKTTSPCLKMVEFITDIYGVKMIDFYLLVACSIIKRK